MIVKRIMLQPLYWLHERMGRMYFNCAFFFAIIEQSLYSIVLV